MNKSTRMLVWLAVVAVAALTATSGCGGQAEAEKQDEVSFSPQSMADIIHSVVSGHRNVYTNMVVNRLSEEGVVRASETWERDRALLLPAQLFRHSAERVTADNYNFDYHLRSLWPVRQQNAPQTPVEEAGLRFVATTPERAYYAEEEIDGTRYFVGVYADRAVAPACVSCHNEHPDTPRTNFAMNDVMGGVVVKIPLN